MARHVLGERQMEIVNQMARSSSDEQLLVIVEAVEGGQPLGHVELQAIKELARRYRDHTAQTVERAAE